MRLLSQHYKVPFEPKGSFQDSRLMKIMMKHVAGDLSMMPDGIVSAILFLVFYSIVYHLFTRLEIQPTFLICFT